MKTLTGGLVLTATIGLSSPGSVDKVGERNCLLLTYQEEGSDTIYALLLDCGQEIPVYSRTTPRSDDYGRLDLQYCPDFSRMKGLTIAGVLISHKHRDHVGALGEFLRLYPRVPVVCSPSTLAFIKGDLLDEGARDRLQWDTRAHVTLGPFEVSSFPVLHSTDGSLGFVISAGGVKVAYSGDIKTPATVRAEGAVPDRYRQYLRALREVGRMGIDYLILDSTNSDERGYAGIEEDVVPVIEEILRENTEGRVYVSSFASNEERERNIIHEARRQGRVVYVAGSSPQTMLEIARIRGWTPLYRRTVRGMPDDAVILCTGHQGEPNSFLDRLAYGELAYPLEIRPADALAILADTIPLPHIEKQVGEEVEELSRPGMFTKIFLTPATPPVTSRGADIVYVDGHVSGHGKEEDLRGEIRHIDPACIIAYHGTPQKNERLHEIASRMGIPHLDLDAQATLELQKARL